MRLSFTHLLMIAAFCCLAFVPSSNARADLMSTASLLDASPASLVELGLNLRVETGSSSSASQPTAPRRNHTRFNEQDPGFFSPAASTGSMTGSPSGASSAAGGMSAALYPAICCPKSVSSGRLYLATMLKPQPPALGGVFHPPREL
ncbi:MAG: hypothetical protein KDA79_16405 [Planctomycetaceae bacterium]|nr:hypothetical protein [Planctomycetaceae bacterium]